MTIKIPGYEIIDTIGKGGMAEVFLAKQKTLHRDIAIKVLSPSLAEDPQFGERFLRETRIIANLPHPNIVPVYDAGIIGKQYYLVMEYLKGGCLSDRIKLGVTLKDAIQYTLDIAEALSFAHEQGFIHRDIKPDNVLFRTQAKNAVLSDFGIARSTAADSSLTQVNLVIGTPKYMSPQQRLGETLNEQSDIFSLGIILFEMLCSRTPYKSKSIGQPGVQHRETGSLALPPNMNTLQPIINKALAFKLDDRYQNAKSLIADLIQVKQTLAATGIENNDDDSTVILKKSAKQDKDLTLPRKKLPANSKSTKSSKLYLLVTAVILASALAYYFSSTHNPRGVKEATVVLPTKDTTANQPTLKSKPKEIKPLPLIISLTPQHATIEIQTKSHFIPYLKNALLPGELVLKISAIGYVSQIVRYSHPNKRSLNIQLQPTETVSPQELLMYQEVVESKDQQLIDRFKALYPDSPFTYVIDYTSNQQTLEYIRSLAETGDVVARASIAEILDSPEINNRTDALYWSSLAAQANFPLGQTQYALMLLDDNSLADDKVDMVIRLLQQSSDRGFYLAKSKLAELYLVGKYVGKDLIQGIKLFKEAARLNDPYANSTLAKIYHSGYGSIKPNFDLAKHYKEESDLLNSQAQLEPDLEK